MSGSGVSPVFEASDTQVAHRDFAHEENAPDAWSDPGPLARRKKGRALHYFAGSFGLFALVYACAFNVAVRVNTDAALSRYQILSADGRHRDAAPYAARAIRQLSKSAAPGDRIDALRAQYAATLIAAGKLSKGAAVYRGLIETSWYQKQAPLDRAAIRDHLARADLIGGDVDAAVSVYLDFIEQTGAAPADRAIDDALPAFLDGAAMRAAPLFSEALKPVADAIDVESADRKALLTSAARRAELGAVYAMREDTLYAAAGLLSSAHAMRAAGLGPEHADTVRVALILGPVYERLDRLSDAERLYLDAFHAQEKIKGSNNPDLSLYIKLLVGVYQSQGRATEAEALKEHMRTIFRDAFGAQRYAANRERDRSLDINRPVSQQFVLPSAYAPRDLVSAFDFSLPLSKNPDLDEMKIRLAADVTDGVDPREANMPVRLAQLISLCSAETGESLTLRSGYRSFTTQRDLFGRLGHKGTVTPPGMSEHQLGLAADIDVNGRLMRQSDKAYQCFEENAFRFGFILSYPPGNDYLPTRDSFEPWHWRYVGVQTAQLYREAGPANRPQEFLDRLPCYEEKAATSAGGPMGETDLCLSETRTATIEELIPVVDPEPSPASPAPSAVPAQKLNNLSESGRKPSQ